MTTQERFSRRQAVVGVGAAALAGAIGVPAVLSLREPRRGSGAAGDRDGDRSAAREPDHVVSNEEQQLPAPSEDVLALFGPLRDGTAISTHWRIERIHALRGGAIPVVMSTIHGGRFVVDVFRADPTGPAPIARAGALALHLSNRGDGSTRTDELAGLGVMALGRALEARLAEGGPVPDGLTNWRARAHRPRGGFEVPLA